MIRKQRISKKIVKSFLYAPLFIATAFGLYSDWGSSSGVNVVFDLGGVLIDTSYSAVSRCVGINKFLYYILAKRRHPRKIFFEVLDSIEISSLNDYEKNACDSHGNRLPAAMLAWFRGDASGEEIIEAVNTHLQDPENGYCKAEKSLVKAMVEVIFDPAFSEKTKVIYKRGLELVKYCKEQGYRVFILSNLDEDSWIVLQNMLPGFFEQFDGIVISAKVGLIKPDPAIFEYMLNQCQLNPHNTVFIDDQDENLKAAEAFGIHPIKCSKKGRLSKAPNYDAILMELDDWNEKRIANSDQEKVASYRQI